MIEFRSSSDDGATNGWMVTAIVSFVMVLVLAGLSLWAFVSYREQKTNVDTRISAAIAKAEKEQADADEAKFAEREKEPNTTFTGPDDYGRVTFKYPKTWSVYIGKDASSGGNYEAYFNPGAVQPIGTDQQFALRVLIEEKSYDKVVATYDNLVKKGDLKSSTFTANGVNGTRLDGNFSKDIRGSAVMFKVRDKTLTVRTDADTFKADFDKLAATIEFE